MVKLYKINKKLKIEKGQEIIKEIFSNNDVKMEIITSNNASSPKGFWYNQDQNEFVYLSKGKAILNIDNKIYNLKKGDYLNIPANLKHRVEKTSKKCIWLCVFYKGKIND